MKKTHESLMEKQARLLAAKKALDEAENDYRQSANAAALRCLHCACEILIADVHGGNIAVLILQQVPQGRDVEMTHAWQVFLCGDCCNEMQLYSFLRGERE